MGLSTRSILFVTVAALVYAVQTVPVSLSCYGNNVHKVIGGNRETTTRSFDCPTCTHPKLCLSSGRCLVLSTTAVHVFQDGQLSQAPVAIDARCIPQGIYESTFDPGYVVLIQCQASAPDYQPAIQYLELNAQETEFEPVRFIPSINRDNNYIHRPDNYAIAPGDNKDFVVAVIDTPSGHKLLVHSERNYQVTVEDCTSIVGLHRGPPSEGRLTLVVDCLQDSREIKRQRVRISDEDLSSTPDVVTLPTTIVNDTVHFSPADTYILYVGTTQVRIVQTNQVTATPGILDFDGLIAQAEFLGDSHLLVSEPGSGRTLVDLYMFFSSDFQSGRYQLSSSEAYCPLGECPPTVVNNNILYLFAVDRSSPSYLNLVSFNLSDPTSSPTQIGRTVRDNIFDICFPIALPTATEDPTTTTTTIEDVTTSTTVTPSPTTSEPVTMETTTTEDASTTFGSTNVGGLGTTSSLDGGQTAAVGIGGAIVVTFILSLTVLGVVVACKKYKHRPPIKKHLNHYQESQHAVDIKLTGSSQNPYQVYSARPPSSINSSNSHSLASIRTTSTQDLSELPGEVVPAKQESKMKHLEVPQAPAGSAIGTTQRVLPTGS